MKKKLHFAHGNGFPSLCYRQMLTPLGEVYDICYIEKIGHNPLFPIQDNWLYLVDEILDSIRKQSETPVIAIGHSLGGVLSLLAAFKAPQYFEAVILLDSPLLSPWRAYAVKWAKRLGVIDNVTPAYRTRTRRKHWNNRASVMHYLRGKTLFSDFTQECLQDYIDFGMTHDSEGYTLNFHPEKEYLIYKTLPHSIHAHPAPLPFPVVLIYGRDTHVIHPADRRYMQKKFGIKSVPIDGTHMFPFEYPDETATLILSLLKTMG